MTVRPPAWADLALAVAAACCAGFALGLPPGPLRLALVVPLLALLPGYLLLQAIIVPRPAGLAWARQAAFALGLTPPLVGLLAFSTSFVQGGFRPVPIVATIVAATVALAAVAAVRRWSVPIPVGGRETAEAAEGPP